MSSALTTLFTGRCPRCGQGRIFDGVFSIRERCDHCGAVYYRDPGSWTGATAVSFMLSSVFVVVALVVLWSTGMLLHRGIEQFLVPAVAIFALLTFRLVKAFWVGLLDDWGYVYPDPVGAPADDDDGQDDAPTDPTP